LLGLDVPRREKGSTSLQQVERGPAQNYGQHECRDPVMPAKERIAEEKSDSEYEHLHCEQREHCGGNREARAFADVSRDLSKLDAREMNFFPRQMCSVFSNLAEELPNSAIRLWCARHLHR
jgi:hypothetical protein